MKQLFQDLDDYLTWHPNVLAYAGLTILVATVAYCWSIALTF